MRRTFTCTFEISGTLENSLFSIIYMFSLCFLYSCFSPCNDFLFLCKDHYENKVIKPVLCHPCQYHLVNVNVYFIFHLFFCCMFIFVAFSLSVKCIFILAKLYLHYETTYYFLMKFIL